MKTFKYKLNGKELTIRLDEKQGTVADLLIDGFHPQVAPEDMPAYAAVISLALIEYEVEIVHDEEPEVITLNHTHKSGWNNPLALMNQL